MLVHGMIVDDSITWVVQVFLQRSGSSFCNVSWDPMLAQQLINGSLFLVDDNTGVTVDMKKVGYYNFTLSGCQWRHN